ncbi:MAG: transcriptional repressor [Anaerolineae bacterium]|nr:transcriptional repressor [Anaerolineae bacterium]
MDTQARFQELQAKLKAAGYRATPQRIALLKILAASTGHPSAMQIYEQLRRHFPTTTLATVYKTLTLLKEMGEVLELEFSGAENRYDGNKPHPHLHLVCVECQRIIDPEIAPLTHVSAQVAKTTGYQIVGQRFELYGICPECQTVQKKHSKGTHRKHSG